MPIKKSILTLLLLTPNIAFARGGSYGSGSALDPVNIVFGLLFFYGMFYSLKIAFIDKPKHRDFFECVLIGILASLPIFFIAFIIGEVDMLKENWWWWMASVIGFVWYKSSSVSPGDDTN